MLSKKNSMVTMVTDEFLENRIILQKSVATIGFLWFFWFQKCILLYIFVQVFLVMRSIRSHISLFRLGFTPTLSKYGEREFLNVSVYVLNCFSECRNCKQRKGIVLQRPSVSEFRYAYLISETSLNYEFRRTWSQNYQQLFEKKICMCFL